MSAMAVEAARRDMRLLAVTCGGQPNSRVEVLVPKLLVARRAR
jgi:hypothetical protein